MLEGGASARLGVAPRVVAWLVGGISFWPARPSRPIGAVRRRGERRCARHDARAVRADPRDRAGAARRPGAAGRLLGSWPRLRRDAGSRRVGAHRRDREPLSRSARGASRCCAVDLAGPRRRRPGTSGSPAAPSPSRYGARRRAAAGARARDHCPGCRSRGSLGLGDRLARGPRRPLAAAAPPMLVIGVPPPRAAPRRRSASARSSSAAPTQPGRRGSARAGRRRHRSPRRCAEDWTARWRSPRASSSARTSGGNVRSSPVGGRRLAVGEPAEAVVDAAETPSLATRRAPTRSAQSRACETNFERAFEERPEVYAAWQQLNGAIKARMDRAATSSRPLAAVHGLHSSYCSLAHGTGAPRCPSASRFG